MLNRSAWVCVGMPVAFLGRWKNARHGTRRCKTQAIRGCQAMLFQFLLIVMGLGVSGFATFGALRPMQNTDPFCI